MTPTTVTPSEQPRGQHELTVDELARAAGMTRGVRLVTPTAVRWDRWAQVWRAAGLDPARSQSGPRDNAYGISREGAAWGRRAILDLTARADYDADHIHQYPRGKEHAA